MTDVWQVVNQSGIFTSREESTTNEYTFKVPYPMVDPPNPAFIVSLCTSLDDAFTPPTYINTIVNNPRSTDDKYTYLLQNGIGQDEWLANLKDKAGFGPILIFIHGFNNLAPAAVTRYMVVREGMSSAGGGVTVVCFD